MFIKKSELNSLRKQNRILLNVTKNMSGQIENLQKGYNELCVDIEKKNKHIQELKMLVNANNDIAIKVIRQYSEYIR